jgi:hypothetical protein
VCDASDRDEDCDGAADDLDADVASFGFVTSWPDLDGDGFGDAASPLESCDIPVEHVTNDADCDDADDGIWPGAEERCDERDNDCDGDIDEEVLLDVHADRDGDGYGNPDESMAACAPGRGWVIDATDCDDTDVRVFPGARESCDARDEDCDGEADEGLTLYFLDTDGDGYGTGAGSCATVGAAADGDCDDADAWVFPGAPERCNDAPDDCDTWSGWVASDEDGVVSFVDAAGAWTDLTADFAGSAVTYALADGTYLLCPGTYDVQLTTSGVTARVEGPQGAGLTRLSPTAASGSVVSVSEGAVTLVGLTLSGGVGAGTAGDSWGGGVYATSAAGPATPTVTLEEVVISGNEASFGGGFAVDGAAWVEIADAEVRGNTATEGGGAFVGAGAALTGDDLLLEANVAADGGGLYVDGTSTTGGSVDLFAPTFSGNEAETGAGVFLVGGAATLDCTGGGGLTSNVADGGGAAYILYATARLSVRTCDLGDGSDDNQPQDILFFLPFTYDYGAGATFVCVGGVCS